MCAQFKRSEWYYVPDKWEFRVALRALQPGAWVLEVGVESGHFLQEAKARGLTASWVELNPSAAARVRAQGFDIFEADLGDLADRIDSPFDVVCAFQVLEHVPDPRGLPECMLEVFKPGGRLVLSLPNAGVTRVIDPRRDNLLDQPPHHMSHWDECVFRSLEKLLPVRVADVKREPLTSYHMNGLVSRYLHVLLSPLGKLLTRLIVNRNRVLAIEWLMLAGARKWLPGQTLLIEFEYRAD